MRGQSGLWGYSISGDLPIVLLQIGDTANIDIVRQLVRAHAYWRLKGLAVDLVIWNEDHTSYRQQLNDQIMGLIAAGIEAHVIDRPGGIFVRSRPSTFPARTASCSRRCPGRSFATTAARSAIRSTSQQTVPAPPPRFQPATAHVPEPSMPNPQLAPDRTCSSSMVWAASRATGASMSLPRHPVASRRRRGSTYWPIRSSGLSFQKAASAIPGVKTLTNTG
jgi:hypothetical protein